MRTDIMAPEKYEIELLPLDASDFGSNDWFDCPECGKNLKIGWFMSPDQSCNGCDTELSAAIVTRTE